MARQLTPKDIVEQEFKTSMRGYNPTEVDDFLDVIISDYTDYEQELEAYREEIEQLQEVVQRLRHENKELENHWAQNHEEVGEGAGPVSDASSTSGGLDISNFDILKRLSNLERAVFSPNEDN